MAITIHFLDGKVVISNGESNSVTIEKSDIPILIDMLNVEMTKPIKTWLDA